MKPSSINNILKYNAKQKNRNTIVQSEHQHKRCPRLKKNNLNPISTLTTPNQYSFNYYIISPSPNVNNIEPYDEKLK